MLKVFFSSHGHMSSGMKHTSEILIGKMDNLTIFDAYIDQDTVQEHLDAFYSNVGEEDQVILMSDILGGSVNQIMSLYMDKPNTTLISGVNLSLLIEILTRDEISESELNEIIEESRKMLCIVKLDDDISEEEFF
jgi:mannose/fructose-specific phosphotransferase system component IIA